MKNLVNSAERTDLWLEERFYVLYSQYFSDVEIPNRLIVRFGSRTRRRLGSISSQKSVHGLTSIIRINKLFQNPSVPDYVIDATLLHEFAHYTHGFHSPHPRRYAHPHRGDVIGKELRARSCHHLVDKQDLWLKAHYAQFLAEHHPHTQRQRKRKPRRLPRKLKLRDLFFP